jgi:MFS family permease
MGGMACAVVGLLLFATVGSHTAFFPTIFLASFAIGFGIGNAFMPLLTIAMADVPAADAGLGSGITNVSQQISGALGLAVFSTIAANHTKGLLAAHHGVNASLIGGYRVAFIAAAGAIAIGIALALALLRARRPSPDLSRAEPAPAHDSPALTELELEQAA